MSRKHSIRWRLKGIAMLSSGLSLLLACGCFVVWNQMSVRRMLESRLRNLAEIIAFQSNVAASVDDTRNAGEILGGLSAEPEIMDARVYGRSGTVLARYVRPDVPGSGPSEGIEPLEVSIPIVQGGVPLGRVTIRSDLREVSSQFRMSLAVVAAFLLVSLATAYALSSRVERAVTGPILHLAGLVKEVGDRKDYSLRSASSPGDEIGVLTEGFNDMLAQIQGRDLELGAARAELERRVEERTRELQAKEQQLMQSQKMEAVGRLAGGIAHDFNNLLAAILGFSELTLARPDLDAKSRENLSEISRASRRAAELTKQLLAFSRRQIFKTALIDLNALVSDVHGMLQRLIGDQVELALSMDKDLGCVKADPVQLQQVLLNLAINARDAMPRGGRLTIETRAEQVATPVLWRSERVEPGRYAALTVTDTGEGMSEEVQSRLFEPFFTTKEQGKGTGLGLSTVYGIVKQSGGSILVRSAPGQGTTFTCYLPYAPGAPPQAAPPSPPEPEGSGRETVLVAEDDPVVRRLVTVYLQQSGYTVHAAADGPEAIRIGERLGAGLDLLITDLIMPRMEGRELVERLSARVKGLRVLYMSGYTDDKVFLHGVENASADFLQKPFTPAELREAARKTLSRSARFHTSA